MQYCIILVAFVFLIVIIFELRLTFFGKRTRKPHDDSVSVYNNEIAEPNEFFCEGDLPDGQYEVISVTKDESWGLYFFSIVKDDGFVDTGYATEYAKVGDKNQYVVSGTQKILYLTRQTLREIL